MKKILNYNFLLFSCFISAQKSDKVLPEGNDAFKDKNYVDAEANYRLSQSKNPSKAVASYNLGNSIFRQNQSSEAKGAYLKAIKNAKVYSEKHMAYHNLGNAYMAEKKYAEAVEAYKNALRNNPSDEQTRYNYALAKDYLKNNPPPKDDKKKDDKKDKKDKKDDKKEKKDDQKKDDKGEKDPKKEGENKEEKKEGQPKEQPKPEGGISKQRVENLLEAVNNEEKKIQEKMNGKKVKGKPVKTDKDW